jgi:hypothetical protein
LQKSGIEKERISWEASWEGGRKKKLGLGTYLKREWNHR